MPRTLKPGARFKGYEILEHLSKGMMANAYAARAADGAKVFLKHYKSPTVTVEWYGRYIEYQAEIKDRIQNSLARNYVYQIIEYFEAEAGLGPESRSYFQVFEFVEEGHDLAQIIEQIRARPRSVSWEQRVTLAKVLMKGISVLHEEARVVHCDLKPPNIQLFKDSTIKAGYQLKLIDLDAAIVIDRQAPWHGFQAYSGTPAYFSPEHLAIGSTPGPHSDVFTCGLILYELLAQGHPYLRDLENYLERITTHQADAPRLQGTLPAPACDEAVVAVLHRCLNPDPAQRSNALEVNLVLNGRTPSDVPITITPRPAERPFPEDPMPTPAPVTPTAPPVATPEPEPPPAIPPARAAATIQLIAEGGKSLRLRIRTPIGRSLCRQLGEEAVYLHDPQFDLARNGGGEWVVIPNLDSTNDTLLNGRKLTSSAVLRDGDVLGVGRAEKGIVKMPLTIRLE